jgi:ATP-binding cassette subfamily B multidrug efflux pump
MRPQHKHEKVTEADVSSAVKGIVASSKRFLPFVIVAAIFTLFTTVIAIYSPQILSKLTNEIANNAGTKTIHTDWSYTADDGSTAHGILYYGTILGILYLVNATFTYLTYFVLTGVTQRYANSLRKAIAEKINRLPLSYFDAHQIGDTLSRVTNDVDSVAQSLDQAISMLLSSAFMLIGSLIGMFATSWQMALSAMISIPLMAIFLVLILKFASPQFIARQEKVGKVNSAVEEKYSGQLIVKLFNADKSQDAIFEEKNKSLGRTMFAAQIYGGLIMPLFNFLSYFAYIAVLVVGGVLIANSVAGVNFGTISAFLVYVRLFQQPMSQIGQAINQLQTTVAAGKRVFDFLGEKEVESEEGKARVFAKGGTESIKGEVEFRNVCFSYDPSREIIHDFSAKIKAGSKVAIVGPTGAGKTTMVNLLMRFYEVNSGDILIDGVSIKDMPKEEIHDIFGMVLQDTWVFDGTFRQNVVYNSVDPGTEAVKEVCKEANLYHFVRTLPGKLECNLSDAGTISAGQKQLITIARAMIRKAPLMILDEATSNVDTRTEELVQEAMDNLTKGKTSFIIAHRLSTIKNADLILVMKDGNIIEQGTHDSLMKDNGFYASLYNSQFAFE